MKKIIALTLSLIIITTATGINAVADEPLEQETTAATEALTEETTEETTKNSAKAKKEAQKTLKEQRKELEKKLKDSEKKLKRFENSAKETEEYINALDEKIGVLNEELNVLDKEVAEAQKKMNDLNVQIEPLEKELKELQEQYDKAKAEYDKLNSKFDSTYQAYCLRLRAMYVSGNSSIIVALLTSKDISQFLNRFEMIKAVSKSDTELLNEVTSQMKQIVTEQNGLNERKTELQKAQGVLQAKKSEFEKQKATVVSKQSEIARKKVILSDDRAESDRLFALYAEKSQLYTEFRNEDDALIKQVDDEINALLKGLKAPEEVTTAVISERKEDADADGDYQSKSNLYSLSDGVLNLSYPVKGHRSVSQSFGHYRNGRAHTGIDYPCPTGSKIVAAQKGIVVTVKRLNYSYGYYVMVYHGTDSRGRKIVTLYAHNSSILVSVGQSVNKGQQIAKSGSTGNSTGPHCHFEVIIDGAKVNPKNYLS